MTDQEKDNTWFISLFHILIPTLVSKYFRHRNRNILLKMDRGVVYFERQALKAFPSILYFQETSASGEPIRNSAVRLPRRTLSVTVLCVQRFFLAMMLLFLCVSLAESPKM